MRISDEKLRGMTVIAADGQAVGEVTALFLDSDGWQVDALKVKVRKEVASHLDVARSVFYAGSVEIPIRVVQSISDAIVLTVGVDDLRRLLPSQHEAAPATP
jgi:sporulation protein YlmC with PRC-barrel domain